MKIESKIKRSGGSVIEMFGTKYHFMPNAEGAHVAEVEDEDHIARFLAIPEGYKIHKPGQLKEVKRTEVLLGSSVHPATFEINGKTYALGDVVAGAHKESGLSVDEWNALGDENRHSRIDAQLDKLAATDTDPAAELIQLKDAYKAKFGKKAHHTWSADEIRAKLEAE